MISAIGVLLITLGIFQLVTMTGVLAEMPQPIAWIQLHADTFHLVNQYGLFAVMTTTRPEILIQGSDDSENWKTYEFKYKPGDVTRSLPWVAPYQPRLDWQMWFAALSSPQENPWFSRFLVRLLEGQQEVTNLLAVNPFPAEAAALHSGCYV